MQQPVRFRATRPIDPIRALSVVFALFGAMAAVIAFRRYAGPIGAPIVWPLVALFAIYITFLLLIRARQKGPFHFLEIGIFFGGFLLLYGAWPMIELAVNGFVYNELSEDRLRGLGATPKEIGELGWWYVVFLGSFCAAYVLTRRRDRMPKVILRSKPDLALILTIVAGIAVAVVIRTMFGAAFDLQGQTYVEGFLKVQQLPTIARQIFSRVYSSEQTLHVLLITALAAHYRRTRWLLFAGLIVLVAMHLSRPGARGEFMLLAVATAQMYDFLVRPVPLKLVAVAAVAGFVLFAALGYLRQVGGAKDVPLTRMVLSASEFDAMYGTAYDLKYIRGDSGRALQWPALYWSDLTALIPQQLLPIEKTAPSIWYVNTYYQDVADNGGAFAFGAIPEAVIGAGPMELVWRGAVLGIAFALMHRRLTSRPVSFIYMACYVFVTVWSYQSIRASTFFLISLIAYTFIVPVFVVFAVAFLIRQRKAIGSRLIGALAHRAEERT
jgi:hypothetical protein